MKKCDNCKKTFDIHTVINGKKKNLNSRKYCLECSPFGEHRTRPINQKSIIEIGHKICPVCKKDKSISDFYLRRNKTGAHSYCIKCNNKECQKRVERYKKEAVEYKGGKCKNCGYNIYSGALEFHHIDPTQKDFKISKFRNVNGIVKSELDKCILLCSNCHKEEHHRLNMD